MVSKNNSNIIFRSEPVFDDQKVVQDIITSTGFFYKDEIELAVELVTERLQKGLTSGYYFLFAEKDGRTIGYTCFGPIPATKFSYDLYWIAVHNDFRGTGIGKVLLNKTEIKISELGGQRIYIETSGRDQYISTRAFYIACGYKEDAVLKDFYAPGDDKYIYIKSHN